MLLVLDEAASQLKGNVNPSAHTPPAAEGVEGTFLREDKVEGPSSSSGSRLPRL